MIKISSSIVIPTCNRVDEIVNLFHSIKLQTVQPDEIIVVDSSDKKLEANPEFIKIFNKEFFPESMPVYIFSKEKGAALQRNIGILSASCELIHFIDDDMLLSPDYIQIMNKTFSDDPEFAGGMGTIDNINLQPFRLSRLIKTVFLLQKDFASGNFTFSGMPTHPYGVNQFKKVEVLNGCATYRRLVVKEYLFDENLGAYSYMEDCDLSKRISRHYPLFFNPMAKLEHLTSSNNRVDIIKNRSIFINNYSYLFFKNFYPKNRLRLLGYAWSVLGLFVEAILYRNKNYIKGYCKGLRRFYFNR